MGKKERRSDVVKPANRTDTDTQAYRVEGVEVNDATIRADCRMRRKVIIDSSARKTRRDGLSRSCVMKLIIINRININIFQSPNAYKKCEHVV